VLAGWAAQPAPAQQALTWWLPLERAADLLEQNYAKPVSYEDPQRISRGEVDLLGTPGNQWSRVKEHTLVMPPGIDPAISPVLNAGLVQKVVDAYHQQNPGQARFRVLESKWGVHIVPWQVHDENGALVPASSPLDTVISVPKAARTATEHLVALCQAVTAASGIPLIASTSYFDGYYAANGYLIPLGMTGAEKSARPYMLFEWGAEQKPARDALIDLMQGSSSTMSWRLHCGVMSWGDKTCTIGMRALQVGPRRVVVSGDRCTNCQRIPVGK